MNEIFLKLAIENFYASADAMRNFFMLGVNSDTNSNYEKVKIVQYGEEFNTIKISGMMLREQSWITDAGYATSTEQVISIIKETLASGKKVKLMMNTGGGLVSGTSNLADIIYENRDNIEAYATGMVASAGMWVFSSAGKRYAEATTVLGSIGVVTSVLDDEKYWESKGIVWKEIVSDNAVNKRPDVKSSSGMAEVKRYLTSLESVFLESVSKSLNMSKNEVITGFHKGGLITGQDALDLNVIDSLISYDNKVATMPTVLKADEIANSINGEYVMGAITKEQLDSIQGELEITQKLNETLTSEISKLEDSLASANSTLKGQAQALEDAKVETLKVCSDIVAMAMEHGVDKATMLNMIDSGDINSSAKIALDSKTIGASTVDNSDLEPDDGKQDVEDELAYARDVAKRLSV